MIHKLKTENGKKYSKNSLGHDFMKFFKTNKAISQGFTFMLKMI